MSIKLTDTQTALLSAAVATRATDAFAPAKFVEGQRDARRLATKLIGAGLAKESQGEARRSGAGGVTSKAGHDPMR